MRPEDAQLLEAFDKLFAGRRDCYALGRPKAEKPGKFYFTPARVTDVHHQGAGDPVEFERDLPLTREALWRHLKGEQCIGIYPILDDNTVEWFACDYDGASFEEALEGARTQREKLEAAGIHAYLERSRSGLGLHIWAWFDRPLAAAVVRRALTPLLDMTHIAYDRIYPVQDELSGKGYGNLIALPFFGQAVPQGNSVFLDEASQPISPRDFLLTKPPRKNAAAVLELLALKAPRGPLKTTGKSTPHATGSPARAGDLDYGPLVPTGALKIVSEYGCTFMNHCVKHRDGLQEPLWRRAIQVAAHFDQGRDFAHWMSQGRKYHAASVDRYFDRALQEERAGCRYIQEQWPHLACPGCPNKAPHYLAATPILKLAGGKRNEVERLTDFGEDLKRIEKLQRGHLVSGRAWSIGGLDEYTRLRRGEFVAVGAAPSMGKTWFFVNALVTLARQQVPVFGFSAETGREALRVRILANLAQVDARKLTGEHPEPLSSPEWTRLEAAAAEVGRLPIYLDFTSLTADDVLAQIERVVLRERWNPDTHYVVFFDYLQFGAKMQGDQSEYDRISRLSTEFKFAAKILNQTVVVFSQLRREAEGSQQPDMTWWKNSGRIESDQDLGLIIVGDRVEGELAPRQIWVTKQREGLANVAIPFTLHQNYGVWQPAGVVPTSRQALIPGLAP